MSHGGTTAYDVAADEYWLQHGCHCKRLPWHHIEELDCAEFKDIVTSYDFPPIPIRDMDWSAVRDGYEGGDLIGRGRTEQAAIQDLLDLEADAADASLRKQALTVSTTAAPT